MSKIEQDKPVSLTPEATLLPRNNSRDRWILIGKIALVAAVSLALLAGAATAAVFAWPMVVAIPSVAAFVYMAILLQPGPLLAGAAVGLGFVGATLPFAANEMEMYKKTDHNIKDCVQYAGLGVAAGVLAPIGGVAAMEAAIVVTGVVAVAGLVVGAVGWVFIMMLPGKIPLPR